MLHQLRAWFTRKSKRRDTSDAVSAQTGSDLNHADLEYPLPTYDSLGPIPRVLTPLAQRDPAIAAGYNASQSASAITARAIAEGPGVARAMDRALRRIHNTVPKVIQAYGVEHDHGLVAFIWAAAISASADTARIIAQSPNPSFAINLARRLEHELANGSFDAAFVQILDTIEANTGVRLRHQAATEPATDQKGGIARLNA
ncbi:hypothetical protein SLS64_002130 [Diaporthe eres]|uniref:Uncharacterized protein n=1 Tax=Diaporthe eres TaxID=83184 RepID=A0ABR1PN40_DIAER